MAAGRRTPERRSRALSLAGLGLAAGFLSAFLGIGGGLVLVPVLMILFHEPIKRAVGTSLATIVLVSLVGVATEVVVERSNIHWGIALVLTCGTLAGSWLGAKALVRLAETPLRLIYAGFLIVAALRMLATAGAGDHEGWMTLADRPAAGTILTLAAGVLAGISSVLFGIGGGVVMVPALTFLFQEVPFHAARATSLVTIVPTSAYGTWQHGRMGTVDWAASRRLVPTGLVGAVLGVIAVNRLPARPCRIAFGVFLIAAALRLLMLRSRPEPPSRN